MSRSEFNLRNLILLSHFSTPSNCEPYIEIADHLLLCKFRPGSRFHFQHYMAPCLRDQAFAPDIRSLNRLSVLCRCHNCAENTHGTTVIVMREKVNAVEFEIRCGGRGPPAGRPIKSTSPHTLHATVSFLAHTGGHPSASLSNFNTIRTVF